MTTPPASAAIPVPAVAAAARPGRRIPWRPIASSAVAVVLCAACTPPIRAPHTAPTVAASESAAWPPVPFGGAPAVPHPLPETVLDGDPCTEALTPAQVRIAIGVDVPGKREDLAPVGPACGWFNPDSGGAVGVSYTLNTHTGLSGVYAYSQPRSAVWRVLPPVQGFPAVAHTPGKDGENPKDHCQASVGLTDRYSVDISLTLGESKWNTTDPCGDPLRQISDLVITTLRSKAAP